MKSLVLLVLLVRITAIGIAQQLLTSDLPACGAPVKNFKCWRNLSRLLISKNENLQPTVIEPLQNSNQETFTRFDPPITLRVAAEEWVPHISVSEDPPGNIIIRGPMANLLNALATSLNFKYVLVRPPDGAWGIPVKDGDWNGMIGMVKRNEADLALGPFGLTYSRSRVVDFSSPILIDYYRILVKRPVSEPDPWGFTRPFTWHVWVGIFLSVVATIFGLFFLRRSASDWFDGEELENHGELRNFGGHIWVIYSGLLGQPFSWLMKSLSVRLSVCLWFFVVLIISKSYSSSLTSLLAVRNVPVKYNYLKQVIDDPTLGLIFEKATALVEHLSKVESGVYKDLADVGWRSQFLASSKLYDAAYTLVRNENYALMVEDVTCRKVYSDDFRKYGKCDFYIGKDTYWPLIFCMIGRKGYPLMKTISEKIGRMVSHDLYFKWLDNELPNATACLRAKTKITVNEPYDMTGLWGVFILLVGGLVVSFAALLCEILLSLIMALDP